MNKNTSINPDTLRRLLLRLLDQCFLHNQHHLGSAFSSLSIVAEIFEKMETQDRFVLSNGHAAASLYIALENYLGKDSNVLFKEVGDHPKRGHSWQIDCSTGSLGMGITVAAGMAQARPEIQVYSLVSDGECAEGSVWETLRFANWNNLQNLHVYFNFNGWSGYDRIDKHRLSQEILAVYPRANIRFTTGFPFEKFGLLAHYMRMTEEQYVELRERICVESL